MQKSLSARIAERASTKTPSRNAKNRAAFLAQKPDITHAMEDGWPIKSIWETLHAEGKINFSYQAFRGYVNRLILSSRMSATTPSVSCEPPQSKPAPGTQEPKNVSAPEIKGFHFNPVPNLEELF
ncbi:TPA: TraK family protein [Legionella pneumophila]